ITSLIRFILPPKKMKESFREGGFASFESPGEEWSSVDISLSVVFHSNITVWDEADRASIAVLP
ncbi:MAG: hypothetical protein ACFFCW_35590, partial [Candidatus Hodarchaeota archaeon]